LQQARCSWSLTPSSALAVSLLVPFHPKLCVKQLEHDSLIVDAFIPEAA
jgi:hypothetical protein